MKISRLRCTCDFDDPNYSECDFCGGLYMCPGKCGQLVIDCKCDLIPKGEDNE